jgi:hypothetical protein
MPSTAKVSFNLGLPATPESSDPKLFYELVKLYNAINIIAQNIDGYTRDGTLSTVVDGKAPLDGVGTTGTWPIGITGNAATVTTVSGAQVIAGLGYTPYNSTNPAGYITAASAPVTSVAGKTGAVTLVKGDVGLGNVDNTSDVNKPVSTAQATSIATKEPTIAAGTTAQYWRGDKTWVTLNSSSVGLGNVDNTSDVNKPVSTATTTQLNLKAAKTDNLSVFAATTSLQLKTLLSDETGSGAAVFAADAALVSPTFLDGSIPNTSGTNTITVPDGAAYDCIVTAVQGGIGSSSWAVPCIKRGGTLAIGTIVKTVLSGEPIFSLTIVSNNLSLVVNAANTYVTYAFTRKVLLGA